MQRNWRNIFKAQGFVKFPMQYTTLFYAENFLQHARTTIHHRYFENELSTQSTYVEDNTTGLYAEIFCKTEF
jgi:hypothetical protein